MTSRSIKKESVFRNFILITAVLGVYHFGIRAFVPYYAQIVHWLTLCMETTALVGGIILLLRGRKLSKRNAKAEVEGENGVEDESSTEYYRPAFLRLLKLMLVEFAVFLPIALQFDHTGKYFFVGFDSFPILLFLVLGLYGAYAYHRNGWFIDQAALDSEQYGKAVAKNVMRILRSAALLMGISVVILIPTTFMSYQLRNDNTSSLAQILALYVAVAAELTVVYLFYASWERACHRGRLLSGATLRSVAVVCVLLVASLLFLPNLFGMNALGMKVETESLPLIGWAVRWLTHTDNVPLKAYFLPELLIPFALLCFTSMVLFHENREGKQRLLRGAYWALALALLLPWSNLGAVSVSSVSESQTPSVITPSVITPSTSGSGINGSVAQGGQQTVIIGGSVQTTEDGRNVIILENGDKITEGDKVGISDVIQGAQTSMTVVPGESYYYVNNSPTIVQLGDLPQNVVHVKMKGVGYSDLLVTLLATVGLALLLLALIRKGVLGRVHLCAVVLMVGYMAFTVLNKSIWVEYDLLYGLVNVLFAGYFLFLLLRAVKTKAGNGSQEAEEATREAE